MSHIIQEIKDFDLEKVIRPSFGEISLKRWEPTLNKMLGKLDVISKYWDQVDTDTNSKVENALREILLELNQMSRYDQAQYVADKDSFANRMSQLFNIINQNYSNYAIEALNENGILSNLDFNVRLQQMSENLNKITNDTLTKIRRESDLIIKNANLKAQEIDLIVRKSAENISVLDAQNQFQEGVKQNTTNIKIWGGISISLIVIFCIAIMCMLYHETSGDFTWNVIYHSAIRITILGFIGTLLAFSLRILKSHLHMREHNLHRKRIANSMAAFAQSATSQEHRDLILSRLVDSVASFGNSGMINNEEDGNSKLTIDNITRSLSALKPNGN